MISNPIAPAMRSWGMRMLWLLALLTSPLLGHDMWLQPTRFVANAGDRIELRLLIGEKLRAEQQRPLALDRITRFEFFVQAATVNLLEGAGSLRFPTGSGVLVMERLPANLRLSADKFDAYLEEEGYQELLRRRIVSSDRGPVRERYTRHLKAIVSGNGANDRDYGHVFGMRLELIPLTDPRAALHQLFELQIMFEGDPVSNARVAMVSADGSEQLAWTNESGKVRFRIGTPGLKLARTTLLRPCTGCDGADYESFWGSLTFEVPENQSDSILRP